jgi:hypothetical protein
LYSRAPRDKPKPHVGRVLEYLGVHGSSLSFADCFWKQCEPHPYELERYPLYVDCMLRFSRGASIADAARRTGVNPQSVRTWVMDVNKPKLAHFLNLYLSRGSPKAGWVWLSVNNTTGHAVPRGPVIEVPITILHWNDVATVISQLEPLEAGPMGLPREYLFGFLIGMVIGDAAKSRSKAWHRHLGLVLSKKYDTNARIGDFTCICARNIGLRMHRIADLRKPDHKPHGFYQWVSQASPLVDWIFNAVLGLGDRERTTYDPVKMDWVVNSPLAFRRGLVQGISESDGSVSIASQTVEFWIGPNWDFFRSVLLSFGVRSFRNREALSVTKTQVVRLGDIPVFSPVLRTARYLRFERLAKAKHILHGRRVPIEIRDFIMKNRAGLTVPELSERVLDTFGVVLTFEAVQRWARKPSANLSLTSEAPVRFEEPRRARGSA